MRILIGFLFCLIAINLMGCNGRLLTEKEARHQCYLGQIGNYRFDAGQTIMEGDFSRDSVRLSQLIITFKSDSTFVTNMRVPFLDDTVGKWDAGTCGFENWGEISFNTSPNVIQFDPCLHGDSIFALTGQYREGGENTKFLWFKRLSPIVQYEK